MGKGKACIISKMLYLRLAHTVENLIIYYREQLILLLLRQKPLQLNKRESTRYKTN